MIQLKMYRPDMPVGEIKLPDGYSVRPARNNEGEAWCRCCLGGDLGVESVSQELFEKKMLSDEFIAPEHILFIVDRSGVPAATAAAKYTKDENVGYLHMVGCREDYRGKGLSLPLCAAAVELLRRDGRSECILDTDDFRIPGIRSYLKLGFSPLLGDPGLEDRWINLLPALGRNEIECFYQKGGLLTGTGMLYSNQQP